MTPVGLVKALTLLHLGIPIFSGFFICHTMAGKYEFSIKALHDRYGPVVRVGPNELSFSSEAITQYPDRSGL